MAVVSQLLESSAEAKIQLLHGAMGSRRPQALELYHSNRSKCFNSVEMDGVLSTLKPRYSKTPKRKPS